MAAHRQGDQRNTRSLARAIKTSLQGDQCIQAAEAGSVVKALHTSDPPLIREEWIRILGWYKDAVDRPPHSARAALTTMTAEREDLYQHVLSLGESIPIPKGLPERFR